jgi:hypothetical protein
MHKDYKNFIQFEDALPESYRHVFDEVITRIDHGTVCDLGSHSIAHFWAMGYIERVESYSCYDLSDEAIAIFKKTLQDWQPGDLRKDYSICLNYLYEHNIVQQSPEAIEQQLIEKLDIARPFDFLKDTPDKQYDIVFANESLEIVDDYKDLVTALKTAYGFLKDDGLLLATACPYDIETDDIKKMQQYRIEGRLSPSDDIFALAMGEAGFKNIDIINKTASGFNGYNQLNIFTANR